PNASTYVLSGLETVGQIPDPTAMPPDVLAKGLVNLQQSLGSLLSASYFITVNMDKDLNSGPVTGVLPLLYVFLARSGKVIRDVSLVNLDSSGALQTEPRRGAKTAPGAKIVFSSGTGSERKTLYYFAADVSDKSRWSSAVVEFCRRLGVGD